MTMSPGDHLRVSRGFYAHHGIYVGEGQVIHYSGEVFQKTDAVVRRDSLERFAADGMVTIVSYATAFEPDVVIRNAESRLGENGYALLGNNCEHFAVWCKTDKLVSDQVQDAKAGTASVGGGALATGGAIAAVSSAGAVAGLSGAGIMSGLASVGGIVGSGAIGGVAILGLAPTAAATYAAQIALKDDERFPTAERDARKVGRRATVAGAALGTVGSVAAISAVGTTAGLSAAGITSGFAAIGGTVSGGMAAGVAMTVAAPATAALAVGYGAYRLWKWLAI